MEKAQELERMGEQVIHLEVGEPDFDTPECIKEACFRAIHEGKTHYTHSLGLIELREAISEDYWKRYRVKVLRSRSLWHQGPRQPCFCSSLPFWNLVMKSSSLILIIRVIPISSGLLAGLLIFVEVKEEEGFQYLPEMIREKLHQGVKGILINSPSNPTGNVMPVERMREIAKLSTFIISDEIYHGLIYEGEAHSILEFTDSAFVINGFSKLYAMTGWRLGYVIAPKEFIRPMQKIQQNLFISASSFAQWGALAGLKEAGEDIRRMKETYDRRRRFLIPKLRDLGFGITVEPTGAFYVFANAKNVLSRFLLSGLRYPERSKGWGGTRYRFWDERRRIPPIFLRQFYGEDRRGDESIGKISREISVRIN